MRKEVVLILDCGATNVRVIALDRQGNVIVRSSMSNPSQYSTENRLWQQWSINCILERFFKCCHDILKKTDVNVRGIGVTTFGVDGSIVDESGSLLYPIISWKCQRTIPVMKKVATKLISPEDLQEISGVGNFHFNTLYKLMWLKENCQDSFKKAHRFLFISSLINYHLTGKMTTDITMAGTSQLLNIKTRNFSSYILDKIGISRSLFPPLVEAGESAGYLREKIAKKLGLSPGIPVISTGHDTQFALYGAGASKNQPVLSSGTWEILMVRTNQVSTKLLSKFKYSTCELDSQKLTLNPGIQWLGSGILEWIRKLLWNEKKSWKEIINQAMLIPQGCDRVKMSCDFLSGKAGWNGIDLNTTNFHMYRSALESLSLHLKNQLKNLENIGQFNAKELLLVGGGSKNKLWNQIKANTLQLPIKVLNEPEITVLGAAAFVWYGIDNNTIISLESIRNRFQYRYHYYYPTQ